MCGWNLFWPSRPPSMYKNLLLVYTPRSSILQLIYRTMSERPLNALRFMSIVVVDGATYTFPNTLLQKKKAIEQDVVKIAMEHVSKRIWDEICPLVYEVLLHHDYKLVKYFIFFQRIGDYLFAKGMRLSFLGWKKPRLWGWNILIYVKDYLNLWNWFFQFYYNTNLVTLSL